MEITCPSAQDSCLFSQMLLENGTVLESGSCVAPGQYQEGTYTLTYGPLSSARLNTTCCDNCGSVSQREADSNTVKCHYCSGNTLAPCDSFSVMNCTGNKTVCVTLNGTWSRGGPQILMGCATPDIRHLQVNDTLGPEETGFHLIAKPECSYLVSPTQPGSHTTVTSTNAKTYTCFTCSDLYHCDPLSWPEDRSYRLQTAGILALGEGDSVAWRNGSCLASDDCKLHNSISTLTYSNGFGFWVNTICCRGNCQELTPLSTLPPENTGTAALPASRTLSNFLYPTCSKGHPGPCNCSLNMQCPHGETECVQPDLTSEEGGGNMSLRGYGSQDLCSTLAVIQEHLVLLGHQLSHRPDCSTSHRATLGSQCHSGAVPGLQLALPILVVALGATVLS